MKNERQEFASNTLAFVGDAVFTLFVRQKLAVQNLKAGELTGRAASIVSAASQSRLLVRVTEVLTEEERDIVRRCRNAHTNNRAKNASASDYHRATGLEGLLGHLYLRGDPRLGLVLDACMRAVEEEQDGNYSGATH